MKRNIIISIFAFAIISLVCLGSCTKEDIQNNNTGFNNFSKVKLVKLASNNKSEITMLEFPDVVSYEQTIIELKQLLKSHDQTFLKEYGSLDEEEINKVEKEIGFNWQKPLINFEENLNFANSMRKAYFIAEDQWLKNEELDEKTDPRKIYPFNYAEMTLLNDNGEVKIGDSIIKFTNIGFIMITDGDVKTLDRINSGDMTALNQSNVITSIEKENKGTTCDNWKGYDLPDNYESSKKVKRSVSFHSYPWKGCTESEITSYKKTWAGWIRHRINMSTSSDSQLWSTGCDSIRKKAWTTWDAEYSSYVDVNYADWGAYPQYRAKNGLTVVGGYRYAGKQNYLNLVW